MLRLLIEDFDGKSKLAPINPENADITIGRKEGNVIRLKERNVSRRHARLFSQPDGIYVEPVEARYGVKVNSTKITGPTFITFGDEIRIGDYRLYLQDENRPEIVKPVAQVEQGAVDIPPVMQPKLVVVSSNFAGREYPITKGIITLGRNPNCDIRIEHVSVSGNHAKIVRNERGNFEIEDLGSSNGLKINWLPCTGKHELFSGDTVILGHVMMRYCAPGELWYFNPSGFDDEPKRSAASMWLGIILLIVAVVSAVLVTLFVTGVIGKKESAESKDPVTIIVKDPQTEMSQYTASCENFIYKLDLEAAKENCDKAEAIDPHNDQVMIAKEKLKHELAAYTKYEELIDSIDNEKCEEAILQIETMDNATQVYSKLIRDAGVLEKAKKCRDDEIVVRLNAAIQEENLKSAQEIWEELARRSSDRDRIDALAKDLDRLKAPAKSDSSSSRSSRGSSAPTQAAANEPAVNASDIIARLRKASSASDAKAIYNELPASHKNKPDVLCIYGTILRVRKGDTCEVVKIYKRVGNSDCKGAKDFIASNPQCK